MDEELIARLRDRIVLALRVIEMAHDPQVIATLKEVIEEPEAEIRRLEAPARPAIPLGPE